MWREHGDTRTRRCGSRVWKPERGLADLVKGRPFSLGLSEEGRGRLWIVTVWQLGCTERQSPRPS